MSHLIYLVSRPSPLQRPLIHLYQVTKYATASPSSDNISTPINEDTGGFGFTAEELANSKPFSEIPSPPSYPIFGNFFAFKPFGELDAFDRVPCCTKMHERYGDVVRLHIPFIPFMKKCVEILDPNDFEIILRNEGKNPGRAVSATFTKYRTQREHGLGLFLSNGDEWWKYRQPLNPAMMKVNAARPYLDVQTIIGDELVSMVKEAINQPNANNTHLTIMEDISKYALESVCAIVFDQRLGCMTNSLPMDSWQQKFIDSVHVAIRSSSSLDLNPRHKFLDAMGYKTKKQRKFEESMDYITGVSKNFVEKSRKDWEGISDDELQKKFLPQLLNMSSISMDNKMTLIFDMMIAAIDTTTYTVIHACYLLAKNPDVQERLFAEINQHIKKDQPLTTSALDKCQYLRACIKEANRMLPIAILLTRVPPKDIVVKGYRIPAGTTVFIEQKYVANTPRFIDRPDEFDPNRWLRTKGRKGEASEKLNPFLTLPFGFGPRMCVGKRFADQELNVALIKLIQNFRVEFDGDKLPLRGLGVDVLPIDLNFKFYER